MKSIALNCSLEDLSLDDALVSFKFDVRSVEASVAWVHVMIDMWSEMDSPSKVVFLGRLSTCNDRTPLFSLKYM